MDFARKTNLSLEELLELAKKNNQSCDDYCAHACRGRLRMPDPEMMPIGAIMNEIGMILLKTGDPRAEDALVKLFDSNNEPNIGGLAYFYLLQKINRLKAETVEKVKRYENDPRNTAAVQHVKEKIVYYASMNN